MGAESYRHTMVDLRRCLASSLVTVSLFACGSGGEQARDGGADTGSARPDGAAPPSDAASRDAPTSNPDGSSATCGTCFVQATWHVDNLSPCFDEAFGDGGTETILGAVSTVLSGSLYMCPADPTTLPSQPWSTDSLTADCAGEYTLCVTLKAGNPFAPEPTDCIMAQSCAQGTYAASGQAQTWPPLPAWITDSAQLACAMALDASGGYADLSVSGTATGCGSVSKVLQRVSYCPAGCQANPSGPGCSNCGGPVDAGSD
jgi:hypothetical protein